MSAYRAGVFTLDFGAGRAALAVRVGQPGDLPAALRDLGFGTPRPVVTVVGGAGGMAAADLDRLRAVMAEGVVPAVHAGGATVVDGGTDAGVMRLTGRSRTGFPLVGVAAAGTVILPGSAAAASGVTPLEPHHSHFVLAPGREWGAEAPWIVAVAAGIAAGRPAVTVLVNGGRIACDDAARAVAAGRPVLVLAGSGRAADRIAAAREGERGNDPATRIAGSPLVHIVQISDTTAVRARLGTLLTPPS